jgi:hypothetical protein
LWHGHAKDCQSALREQVAIKIGAIRRSESGEISPTRKSSFAIAGVGRVTPVRAVLKTTHAYLHSTYVDFSTMFFTSFALNSINQQRLATKTLP